MPERRKPKALDPVSLEILWTRLIAVTNEQAAALMRTSFTPIVREVGDLSAAVFDVRGRMLAQAITGTAGHINALATGMRHFLVAHPAPSLRPGDVLITNDPWMTSGQLNDISVVTPVFAGDRLVGFFGNCCHAIDIGGRGLSADASEVFEEGLQIPITKLYRGGEPNQELFRLLRANVRAPDEVLGDLHAQVAGNQVGADRLLHYLDDFHLLDLEDLGDEIVGRSERAMRQAIELVPDGDYHQVCFTDGFSEPVRVEVTLRVRGDEIEADFAGSSAQVERAFNVVLNYTAAYTNYALKCALCPDVPHNEGSFHPVHVTAPLGSIFNPRFPAAVAGRQIAGHFVPHAVFGALAGVLPDRVIAEGAGGIWLTTVRGRGHAPSEDRFVSVFFSAGGTGARPAKDGLSTTAFPSGVATAPVEVIETTGPLVIRRKELRRDSGGPGKQRGGLGQTIEVQVRSPSPSVVSVLSDRFQHAALGYAGGGSGARSRFSTSTGARLDPKLSLDLPAGARFTLELPGGGGFGAPRERERALVEEDLREGLISRRAAREAYGLEPRRGRGRRRGD
ncbi:MAG: hydantoinase B/oxoprolinase family protein [Candidatus Dormibacteraceae bacterium]